MSFITNEKEKKSSQPHAFPSCVHFTKHVLLCPCFIVKLSSQYEGGEKKKKEKTTEHLRGL